MLTTLSMDLSARTPQELENLLIAFYARYNPEKVSTSKALAIQFAGNENTLNRLLRERYKADISDIASQGNLNLAVAESALSSVQQSSSSKNLLEKPSKCRLDEDIIKWDATMSSIDSALLKTQIIPGDGGNLSAIIKATSKALKAALQENQELKTLNADLCARIEQR
jgi:hypothetical protein